MCDFVQEAFKCAKQAIDADASQNYVEAYSQYMKSMDYFMFSQRCLRPFLPFDLYLRS